MSKIKWKNKKVLKPNIILKKIQDSSTVQQDGSISFSSFEYMENLQAIHSMLLFDKNIDWSIKKQVVYNAIKKSIKEKKLNSDNLINEINYQYQKLLIKKENEYLLLTSISIKAPLPIKRLRLLGCNIRIFNGPFPKKYISRKIHEDNWKLEFPHTPSGYSKVIVKCKAKFAHEAVSKSLNALDLLRSFLCLFLNPGMEFILGIDRKPINRIRLGGMHTLHNINGSPAVDYHWYETNFILSKSLSIQSTKFKYIQDMLKWVLRRFEKSKYSSTLSDSLLRYVRALDHSNANTAAVKLWGALESIATPHNANYDSLTKRVSFLFKDQVYHKQMLEHLREYRNTNVHEGEDIEEAKICCYQMQYYFFELIIFHLNNVNFFQTIQEANMFLDLPMDNDALKMKKKLIDKAIKFTS